jgi:hypothetical protein
MTCHSLQQQQEWRDESSDHRTSHSPVIANRDYRKVCSKGGMKTSMWDTKCFEKNLLQCHLSTAYPIWTPLELNPHPCNGKFLTDCLSYKMSLAQVVYVHITLNQCNTSHKMTYTEHITQQTGIVTPLTMFPRWHQFPLSNFKKTGNVHTYIQCTYNVRFRDVKIPAFQTLHRWSHHAVHCGPKRLLPFTDHHTMQFTAVPTAVTVHNCTHILGCCCCYHNLLRYFLAELIIFMFTLTMLHSSVTHNLSFSTWQTIF